jgi:hypothetical protein
VGDGVGDQDGEGEEVGVGDGMGDGVGDEDGEGERYGKGEMKEEGAEGAGTTFSFVFSTWSDLSRIVETGELMIFLCHKVTGAERDVDESLETV